METEIKDLLSEFNKVTGQIIDLKEVGIVSYQVIKLQQVLLEQIIELFNSKVEHIDLPEINFFELLGENNGTKEALSSTSI